MTPFDPDAAAKMLDLMAEGTRLQRAAPMAGYSPETASQWLAMGRATGHTAMHEFGREVMRIESEHIEEAMRTVRRVMTSPRQRRGGKNASQLNAATWLLERRLPEEYGNRATLAPQIRQEMALELLAFLREHLNAEDYGRVLRALEGRETRRLR